MQGKVSIYFLNNFYFETYPKTVYGYAVHLYRIHNKHLHEVHEYLCLTFKKIVCFRLDVASNAKYVVVFTIPDMLACSTEKERLDSLSFCYWIEYTSVLVFYHFPLQCKSQFYSLVKLGAEEKTNDEMEMDQVCFPVSKIIRVVLNLLIS